MKIKCTMEEYTRIIRMCQRAKDYSECQGCVMANICYDDIIEKAIQFEIIEAEQNDTEDSNELEIEYVTFERSE